MKKDFVPKYYKVKSYIKDCIEKGELVANEQIPTEKALCEQFGVSRITVTRAINELVMEGFLYREQGKGTFVKGSKIEEGVLKLTSFSERMRALGLQVETKLIESKVVLPPPSIAKQLNLNQDNKAIYIQRLRLVENEPFCICNAYYPYNICPLLPEENLEEQSVYALFEEKYGIILGEGVQTIGVGFATNIESKLLKLEPGSPALEIDLIAMLHDGTPVEISKTLYRADKYRYMVKMTK